MILLALDRLKQLQVDWPTKPTDRKRLYAALAGEGQSRRDRWLRSKSALRRWPVVCAAAFHSRN